MNIASRVGLSLSLLVAFISLAQPVCTPGLTSKAGGGITATYTANSSLQVVGKGTSFALMNVSNSAAPFVVSSVELDGQVEGIVSPSSLQYWVLTPTTLYGINGSAIPTPHIDSSSTGERFSGNPDFNIPPMRGARAIGVAGTKQYVTGDSGTYLFESGVVSSYRSLIGEDICMTDGDAPGIADAYVWVASGSGIVRYSQVHIALPPQTYSVTVTYQGANQRVYGLYSEGSRLFVISTGNTGLTGVLSVYDIDAQAHLVLRAQRNFGPASTIRRVRLTRSGNTLYACCGSAGTYWFNISNQVNPVYQNFNLSIGEDRNMSLFGPTAYIAKGDPGLRTANVAAGGAPVSLGLFQSLPGNPRDLDSFSNAYAVVADGYAGMSVFDIQTNPQSPIKLGSLDFGGYVSRVSTSNFLAFFTSGAYIYAVSYLNPAAPSIVGSFSLPNAETPLDVLVYGQKLLVTSATTLYSYDVSTTLSNPPLIDTYNHGAFHAETQMTLGNGKVFMVTDAGVESYFVNLSTGVISYQRTFTMSAGQTILNITSRFAEFPLGTEYLAVVVGEIDPGNGGLDFDRWEVKMHMYGPGGLPSDGLQRYGTWFGPAVIYANELNLPQVRSASMQASLVTLLIDDRVHYVDVNNLFTPVTIGTADVGFADGGTVQATSAGVYAACGHGGLATLRRTFNSAPVGRFANAYPMPVCGGDTTFTASFAGSPLPGNFRWFNVVLPGQPQVFDGVQADGSVISGVTTGQLVVSNIAPGFLSFTCRGENLCGEGVSYTNFFEVAACTTQCDSIDFNNDGGLFDPDDINAFLSVYSEGPCVPASAVCNDIDFNNDNGLFDPCDINSFLVVYSEGPCTNCGV
ncbi:MAG: hypothetical protein U0640_13295 [Phycisphaerales bacterium]